MRVKMSTKDIDSKCHILSILILNWETTFINFTINCSTLPFQ
jgi:hypothetical protein